MKNELLAGVSFAHLNGVALQPASPQPNAKAPAKKADDDEEDDDMKRAKAEKKARRRAKAKKRDDEDDGDDDPDEDDDEDGEDDDEDMSSSSVTGRARARERRRIAAIMSCQAAAKNVAMAVSLACNTNLKRRQAVQLLTDGVALAPPTRRLGTLHTQMLAENIPTVPAQPAGGQQRPADRALSLVAKLRGEKP